MITHRSFRDAIPEMEERLKQLGLNVSDLCAKAGINPTTWSRWKRPLDDGGYEPRSATQRAVYEAFNELAGDSEAA
tara:strand:- start:121 stop:348 length:228 start_codon:yes stop_codon:yes gene_type:complete